MEEAGHMPARVKCAVLAWRTLKEAIDRKNID
jgi:NifU-like protein involved in Fe-S cluster formation